MKSACLFGLAALILAACASKPDIRQYALTTQAAPQRAPQQREPVAYRLERLLVPESVNRAEIVLRAGPQGSDASVYGALTSGVLNAPERAYNFALAPVFNDRPAPVPQPGPNDLEILPNDRWQSPLPDMLTRTLAADLTSRLGAPPVPDSAVDPGVRRIAVRINEFSPGRSGEMALDASWTTVAAGSVATTDESLFNHRVRHVAFTDGTDMKKIVATMSGLIGKLADDIAQTVSPVKAPVRGAK